MECLRESYDPIIGEFTDYKELVERVVAQIDGAENCLDIGAGTGNTTIELHRKAPKRHVHAVDVNHNMLRKLHTKLEQHPGYSERTTIIHGDCITALAGFQDETFDACVMMNVLFALDNPVECLTEVRRVLKYGGVLSLSTSRNSTNIHKLFGKIKEEIEDLRKWEEKKDLYKSAYDRNIEMEPIVVRYSEGDIRRYIERAGFGNRGPNLRLCMLIVS